MKADFMKAFEKVDVILTPTAPSTAFRIGEITNDPWAMYMQDIFTIPVNMVGVPGMSLPCGFSEGLPIGAQLIAKPFDEAALFRFGHTFQKHTDFHNRIPTGVKELV